MGLFRYILRGLWHFRKQHLALFAGTIISTAVLTGALIVGDSVKYSLRDLVDVRLGNAGFALQTGDRYVHADLAERLSMDLGEPVIGISIIDGIGVNPESGIQVNKMQVLGIGSDFSDFFEIKIPDLLPEEALISNNLADKLKLGPGDALIVRVEDVDVIPLNAPFSREASPSVGMRLTVKGVVGNDEMGRFGLKSNQSAPFNLFVGREFLGEKLGIAKLVNTLLVSRGEDIAFTLEGLNELLESNARLEDYSIKLLDISPLDKLELSSGRIFIDDPVAQAMMDAEKNSEKILTYLVNTIRKGDRKTPYSFVSAVTHPYVSADLLEDEVVINDWLAEDLDAGPGDTLEMDYFVVGPLRRLKEERHRFVIKEVIETGAGLVDSTLMPDYPGLSEANNCRDWDTGIPIDLELIRDKDEFYWDDYQGTPKALISLEAGRKLWGNDFGSYTAIRVDKAGMSKQELEAGLLSALHPADMNLAFRDVRQEGLLAADNSVDFGELFLSLSFFVIAAGLLLTVLLFSLQTTSRMGEAGVLAALGFSKRKIVFWRFSESAIVALLGSVAGAGAGILYNYGIMSGLNTVWQDAVNADMLEIHLFTATILIGALSGMVLGLLAIYLVTRSRLKQPVSAIMKNIGSGNSFHPASRKLMNRLLMALAFAGVLVLLVYSFLSDVGQNSALFLSAGGLFLLGMLAGFSDYLNRINTGKDSSVPGIFRLAQKSMARNKVRSLTSIALLALGTFTIIITGANRKTYYGAEDDNRSGTGGFLFWAETTMPLNEDLALPGVREKLGLGDEEALSETKFVQFLTLDGDDASCLNLNQVQQPRILGVDPLEFAGRKSFTFAKLKEGVNRENPWIALRGEYPDKVIPAYADQTVITWGLKKKVGDTLYYLNEKGEQISLLLIGGLSNSIFQGNILIDEDHLRANFPSVSGSSVMLVDAPLKNTEGIAGVLQARLSDFGVDLSKASERLAAFNAVENTYLTVFMMLGGLGVLIGTIGLGIVILRNLLERKAELALLAAIGFNHRDLLKLIVTENLLLLTAGLATGIISALIGILPSLLSPAFTIPGLFMVWIVAAVFASGLLWIFLPALRIIRQRLVAALQND